MLDEVDAQHALQPNQDVVDVQLAADEVDAQHALQPNGRTPIACLGVVRLYHLAQRGPRHDGIHGLQKLFASGGLARLLESAVLICGHCQGLLLHVQITV